MRDIRPPERPNYPLETMTIAQAERQYGRLLPLNGYEMAVISDWPTHEPSTPQARYHVALLILNTRDPNGNPAQLAFYQRARDLRNIGREMEHHFQELMQDGL